ncbi:unnamed protein product [Parnassius apollo]|uniref:RNA helicase n=1 Tax=Parnassius apollo TaxID=110799 RepID=A0A8S3Y7A1_PARAO|nr:unnamed protein product [Parnassius apollo]
MPPESYQVEVLYFINPHLIWIEVKDLPALKGEGFTFEQIGLYGVLPVEPTLDVVEENLKRQISEEWLPAVSATINKALMTAQEVWFCPTYIDRRSSIFDDNIHKYGELIIKDHNKKEKPLSKLLVKSGFAAYDMCLFHQALGLGKINTKLQSSEVAHVIKEIENHYKKKKIPKKDWEESMKSQTVVSRTSQQLESALTTMNLQKHNAVLISQLLKNKNKDFDMCKDVDEEPVGRAYKVKDRGFNCETKAKESKVPRNEPEPKSTLLKKKLDLIASKKSIQDLKDKNDIKQIELNVCKNVGEMFKDQEPDMSNNISCETSYSQQSQGCKHMDKRGRRKLSKKENVSTCNKKRVGYGPPGIDPSKLTLKVMDSDIVPEHPIIREEDVEETNHKEDIYANVDSNVNVKISNKNVLDAIQQDMKIRPTYERKISTNSNNKNNKAVSKFNLSNLSDDSSSDNVITSPSSKVLQKKLILHERLVTKTLNNSSNSCSDTTNNDSSSSLEGVKAKQKESETEVARDSDDDGNIDEIIKKLNEDYPVPNVSNGLKHNNKDSSNSSNFIMKKHSVNPFKNIDPNISLFVDKLVTPVLMVHTKMNKRIEPVCNLGDVNFNSHIHIVLKNMLVERPMKLQTISWFCILRGYSMFMISPAGSGKTLGYLPAVCRLVSDACSDNSESVGPTCIIVCATAKSVAEVEKMAKMFLDVQGKVLSCFAGVDESYVTTFLLNGCDLLICTPSFLVRLLHVTDFGVDLRRLATVVFDDCERLLEVYSNEIKYFMFRIKDTLKNRTNKELRVQYVLASRYWCDFMEPIAKKAPYSVVCIGAYQECVLYSKAGMSVNFVQQENKVKSVLDFLNQIDKTKRTVIVCRTDDEIMTLKKALAKHKNAMFVCDSSMTIQDLFNLRVAWDDFEDPLLGPILLCCDDTLTHMNIMDAHFLLNYSLPQLYSSFCKRFSVLNDNYSSIFVAKDENVKIKILIEENNLEQLPKMLHFIKRCTGDVPQCLNEICDRVLVEKDNVKASNLVPLCDNLLAIGYCPDFWNCLARHTVLKDFDQSKEWIPTSGQITFKILHYYSAIHFSARLLSNSVNGAARKYPQTYSTLSLKMGMYYSKEPNRKLHGIPKIGDICAVSIKQNFFARCQVIKILSKYQRGNPNCVLIKLIDEEKLETTKDIYLYYLPEELKNIDTHVIQVRLANIQPKDKDITFSDLARDQLKKITDKDEDMYIRGQVVMSIGNCVFVDTLEACQDLSSINTTVVKHDFKRDLLDKHAVPNMEHIAKIKSLCVGNIQIEEIAINKVPEPIKLLPQAWSNFENENMSLVFFGSAISPDKFFLRLEKFESCLNSLLKDIQKYVNEISEAICDIKVGDIVLAMYPDDSTYERARIDAIIDKKKVKCFFVDQGDWREVLIKHLAPIKEDFITILPFQAIECRLVGVRPMGKEWTDFSTNWFCDKCYDHDSDRLKHLYVKYFTKEKAEFTEGNKYGIVLMDTNNEQDVMINQLLIDVNLAQENEAEINYLNEFQVNNLNVMENELKKDESFEKDEETCEKHAVIKSNEISPIRTLFQQPIRSVPLVGSDSEESEGSERWNINMVDEFVKMLKPVVKNSSSKPKLNANLPAVTSNEIQTDKKYTIGGRQAITYSKVKQSQNVAKDLDSDGCTSPETSKSTCNLKKRPIKFLSGINQMRKPKLVWRQNKNVAFIKINLIGLETYNLKIQGRSISFTATLNDVDYAFDFELYGSVDVRKSIHVNKGQFVLVKLYKILSKNWLTLTKDGEIRKWIVYDVDSIDASSDEEVVEENTMLNVMKNICNRDDSESEDEDFMDDVNFSHKNDKVISLD